MWNNVLAWILGHKRLLLVYIPVTVAVITGLFVSVVYLSWRADREQVLNKLARYKRLIDRTEELREGMSYNHAEIDLTAKVVDIPTRIYGRNNEIIGEFFDEKREIVPYRHIPKWLINAVIASEDRNFYKHRGVSPRGIFRAFLVNLVHFGVVQGGSTITQQLAKVLFTDMARSLKRKIYEMFCAYEIERRYDKADILCMYLNLIYFGSGAYGVEATAKMFFGKGVRDCDETECAMIVGTISNPLLYSPLSNLDNSIKKTKKIMRSMVDAKFISQRRADYQYKRFLKKWDITFSTAGRAERSLIGSFVSSTFRVNRAPFFNEQIRRLLVEKFGEDVVKKGGLSVYTTIDESRQDMAEKALRDGIARQRKYHEARARRIKNSVQAKSELEKSLDIEGALVAIQPHTGEILSYVGGYAFLNTNQVDNVSQSRRQPGSSFKPIVYAAAIEARDVTPSTMLVDEKTVFAKGYAPRNFDGAYLGNIIIREALKKSVNVVAVKVLEKTGYDKIMDILQKGLDLTPSERSKRFGETLSLALGTYELSPLENCTLHGILVNGGDFIKPYGIRQVKDYNGNVVLNNEEIAKKEISERRQKTGKIIDPAACAVMVSMLRGVFEPGGTAYFAVKGRKFKFQFAGKTGTSSNFNDAWLVGYTADLVTAVWIGNKRGAISLGSGRAGASLAVPVWANYIAGIYRSQSPANFTVPEEGVTRQTICLDSGLVPLKEGLCPHVAVDQLFISGTEPGSYCTLHKEKEKEVKDEK